MYRAYKNLKGNWEFSINDLQDINDIKNEINTNKNLQDGKAIDIVVDLKKYDSNVLQQLEEVAKSCPNELLTSIIISNKNSVIKCKDLEQFINFEDSLNAENKGLFFDGGLNLYDLTQVINAQEKIENFTDKIKKLDASPFEKYLIIYNFLTSKIYKENNLDKSKSRDIIGILNGDNIVCAGYSNMLKRLCNEVGIECIEQGCDVFSKQDEKYLGAHSNNLVKMKDEKYGIDGLFYADACWDSVKEGEENEKIFSHCLLPLEDVNNMKKDIIKIQFDKQIYYNEKIDSVLCYDISYGCDEFGKNFEFDKNQEKHKLLDENKRIKACERLATIFKQNNIPEDFYYKNKDIPKICNLSRLLALCMEDELDQKRINETLSVMKKVLELGDNFKSFEQGLAIDFGQKEYQNVYQELNKLADVKNTTEKEDFVWDDKYSFSQVFEAIKKNDKQSLEKYGVRKEKVSIDPILPYNWEKVIDCSEDIQKERHIINEVKQYVGNSQPISFDVFKKAIKKSFELVGLDEQMADYQSEKAINNTVLSNQYIFEDNALNCFSKQAILNKENSYTK